MIVNKRGDTIVEVLIAILVITTVLGAAYASVNTSANGARQSQERSQAIQAMEAQTESLKQEASNGSTTVFSRPKIFCMSLSTNTPVDAHSPARTSVLALGSDNFKKYVDECADTSEGTPYYLSIERAGDSSVGFSFTVRVRWDRAGGGNDGGQDEASLIYRLWR
ncbi:MAG TPA: hypothetical protein VLE69_01640 [Candidatus Saccharimonadales bacterium]|nr:hypothetical protein [Candidatus Saccharimonadales bacterium]